MFLTTPILVFLYNAVPVHQCDLRGDAGAYDAVAHLREPSPPSMSHGTYITVHVCIYVLLVYLCCM